MPVLTRSRHPVSQLFSKPGVHTEGDGCELTIRAELITQADAMYIKKPDIDWPITKTHLQADLHLVFYGIKCSIG